MVAGKLVIGIAGGIGSGKSFVARLFGELGCAVIDSDAQAKAAYHDPAVRAALCEWWGGEVLLPGGEINTPAIAQKVFADESERRRLEGLIHPWVAAARQREMAVAAENPQVVAYVWDTPLLFEAGLDADCDTVVFVHVPLAQRLERVRKTRGWTEAELLQRQKSQWPLDKKGRMSDYVVTNTADADYARSQVREVFSRILARSLNRPE